MSEKDVEADIASASVHDRDVTQEGSRVSIIKDFDPKTQNLLGQPKWPKRKFLPTFFGLGLAMFLVCASETISNQQVASLATTMKTTIFSQWLVSGYLLTCVMVQPIYVKLAEIYGRKWPLFISIFIFSVFSIMCGASQSFIAIVLGRAFQGLGGAGVMPLSLVVLTDITTPHHRPLWLGLFGAIIILGMWIGPLLGSAWLEYSSWRWAYYHSAICGFASLGILGFTLHDLPSPPGMLSRKIRHFDYLGTLTWLGGSIMILLALAWGGNEHPWRSATIVCLFVIGFFVIIVFGIIELRFTKWPIIPLHLLVKPQVLLSTIASAFVGMAACGEIFFVPIYYHTVRNQNNTHASAQLLWFALGGCVSAIAAGIACVKTYNYRIFILAGTALMAIGYGLMYTWKVEEQRGKEIGYQIITGFGFGLCTQQILLAGQAGLKFNDVATVTTLVDYSRTLGGMIGLVIGEVILKDQIIKKMDDVLDGLSFLPKVDLSRMDLVTLQNYLPLLNKLSSSITAPIYEAIVGAIGLTLAVYVAFAGAAFLASIFLKPKPLVSPQPVSS
ncbi:hypothetical protein H4219_002176 [Mycoemilia scoparia]|uniref:Major facilitator superfamily (MFS) profile domain-containing protein n=1 Tax=Mycoemilia scoparia TaxID=417184 RepID=A0A9W7ZYA1_9FUNG|nr:hypothetical protein H4219_002176 [Mycoemilia scoparia]